ncbi:MAG: folate-binding protein YgfZ [Phycisphaerales bacterium]|jgi:folate-binding protein YgfZ
MTNPSPLKARHDRQHAMQLEYGPAGTGVVVVETFGNLEFEYASARKGCVLLDHAQRGTIEIRGEDRLSFLSSMVTQNLTTLTPMTHRSSFWLNRKGKIIADLRLCELGDRIVADVDVLSAQAAADSLNEYVITEDVQIEAITDRTHRLGLHGPTAADLLGLASGGEGPVTIDEGHAAWLDIAGHRVLVERTDWLGEPGFELSLAPDGVVAVWELLCEVGFPPELDPDTGEPHEPATPTQSRIRMRPTGWLAVNMARIEAGSAMFNLDFGGNSLPAETGLLSERVDFKKGCYLGQEVVARMDALGRPKQVLVGLAFEGERVTASHAEPRQPITGAEVFKPEDPTGNPVGSVTSSTLSPMLGGLPVCFATVRYAHREPGTKLLVTADGEQIEATVQPSLRFWPRP